ncbi:Cu(I)-responsive transcriptional regulator [Yoonia sp. BS5-3]|uniref:Cu(I)-responsive transcriptional regulator n=1 Tax=Yoonia phaeophyticola TaxID=3137369 RepID=A0ABZ2V1W5_9RHOB
MNIGQIATHTGLPAKTIRYYEEIGLVTPKRGENGYRIFAENDAHKLIFLGRARALGFSIDDCRNLLKLWEDKDRASADVRHIATRHLDEIDNKIKDLRAMRDSLADLVRNCAGDARPDCPILTGLQGVTKSS